MSVVSAALQKQRIGLAALAGGLLLLAACTSVHVTPEAAAGEALPRPERILVYSFAVTPQEVQLDSVGEEISKTFDGTAQSEQEQQVGRAVANALARELVKNIQAMGLPAESASGPPPQVGTNVLILGQLLSIDQGSETERVLIGLGAGRSDVEARAQVYERMGETKVAIEMIQGTAKSAVTPGAAETLGVGALAGHLLVSAAVTAGSQVAAEELSSNVDSEAKRLADKVADQLRVLFAAKGWIAPGTSS